MPDTRSAVAVREEEAEQRQRNLAAFVEKLGPQIARVMSGPKESDRLVRIAISAARNSPGLTEATPLSLAGSLMTAATLGLEPNTPAGECYLVPYKDRRKQVTEAQLIVGYQGYVKLYRQHPMAGDIFAEAVYPEDVFDYARGTNPFVDHRPRPKDRAADSKPTHYYAVAILSNGAKPFVVLTAEEVKELRRGKEGSSGDIPDPQRWMERKTALRQLVKMLPKSSVLALAAQVDEADGTALYAQRVQAQRADQAPAPAGVDTSTGELTAGPGYTGAPDGSGGDTAWPTTAEIPGTSTVVEDPPAGGEGL